MSLLILSATDVDKLVSGFQPEELQLLMARVFSSFSFSHQLCALERNAALSMPPRITILTENHDVLFMPARIGPGSTLNGRGENPSGRPSLAATTVKIVSVPRDKDAGGLPGTTVVLDEKTGVAKAIINARKLTALRNAAGSLLSTNLVGPSKPNNLVVFGAGQQIQMHIDLFLRYFPSIDNCTIINRTINPRTQSLGAKAKAHFPAVKFDLLGSENGCNGIERHVREAHIIICATPSTKPLFPAKWVRDGTHVILIGSYTPAMREVDADLIRRSLPQIPQGETPTQSQLIVDSREACLREAGELLDAEIQAVNMVEIGELVPIDANGDLDQTRYGKTLSRIVSPQRRSFDGPITLFKSVGIGLQDVAIASAVVEKASITPGVGTVIGSYDFMDQD